MNPIEGFSRHPPRIRTVIPPVHSSEVLTENSLGFSTEDHPEYPSACPHAVPPGNLKEFFLRIIQKFFFKIVQAVP